MRRPWSPFAHLFIFTLLAKAAEKHGPLLAIYVFLAGSALLWAHECEKAAGRPLWPLLPRRRS